MKLSILAGATSQSFNVFIADSSSTTGAGLTGLVFNTASLVCYYTFTGTNTTATSVTLATLAAVNSAYSSGGFKEIDATNMPGWYRFDPPDAALASAKGRVVNFHFKGATNMAPLPVEIALESWNNQTAISPTGDTFTRLGAPAGASTAADIASVKTDTGTTIPGRIPAALAADGSIKASLQSILATAFTEANAGDISAAFKKFFNKTSPTGTINSIPDVVAGATNGLFIAGTNAATTVTTALTTTFTGNLTGSVASVTGNVGGNVTGSVGSLAAQAKADVNAEVVDALAVDTYAESGQGAPAATTTLAVKIGYIYKAFRNKKTQTATTFSLFNDDAATVDQKATTSDDGTTATVGEIATGP